MAIEFAPLFELSFRLSLKALLVLRSVLVLFKFAAQIFSLIIAISSSFKFVIFSTAVRSGSLGSKTSFNLYNTGSFIVSTRAYCWALEGWYTPIPIVISLVFSGSFTFVV